MRNGNVLSFAVAMAVCSPCLLTSGDAKALNAFVPGTYGYPDAYNYTCFSTNGASVVLNSSCAGGVDRFWLYPVLWNDGGTPTNTISWTAGTLGTSLLGGLACGRVWTYTADGQNFAVTTESCGTGNKSKTPTIGSGSQAVLAMRMQRPIAGTLGITRVWSNGF